VSNTLEHAAPTRAVLHVGNLHYASEKSVVERVLAIAGHADGHGHGGHAGMSMPAMVADMRNPAGT
jgi:hypothetical protein